MQSKAIFTTHETLGYRIILRGDGIIRVYSKPKDVTEDHIIELHDKLKEIGKGKAMLVLINPTEENSMSPSARKRVEQMGDVFKSLAVLSDKLHVKILANIFLKSKDLTFSMKLFNTEEAAIDWLKQQ